MSPAPPGKKSGERVLPSPEIFSTFSCENGAFGCIFGTVSRKLSFESDSLDDRPSWSLRGDVPPPLRLRQ